jgi:phosphopantetheinyl transferase
MPANAGVALNLFALADTAAHLEWVETDIGLLAPDEIAAVGLTKERRLARIAVRLVLAAAGMRSALRHPFAYSAAGKPALLGEAIAFNMSHTRGHVLVALAARGPVGVDIEAPRTPRLSPHRAAQMIAAAEALGLAVGGDRARPSKVLAAWTMLEALAKADGCGMGALLTELGILGPGGRSRTPDGVAGAVRLHQRRGGLSVAQLELGGELVGAVCTPDAELGLARISVAPLSGEDCARLARSARARLAGTASSG